MPSDVRDRLAAARDGLLPRADEGTFGGLEVLRKRRRSRQRVGSIVLASVLVVAGSTLLVRAFGDGDPPADRPLPSVPSSTTPRSVDPTDDRWGSEVRIEDGVAVMPLTFPDGTTAELLSDPLAGLDELLAFPNTYIDGPGGCGSTVSAVRSDPTGGWIRGNTPPMFEHTRADGMTVALWEGQPSNRPYDYLVYPFGDWSVIVGCRVGRDGPDPDVLRAWIEGLDGRQTADGFIVFESRDPIRVNLWTDIRSSPTISLQGRDLIIDLRATDGCDGAFAPDLTVDDEVAQWCLDRDLGIYVYATAWSREARDRLQLFIETAQIRPTS